MDESAEKFSSRRARAHYVALAGLGARGPGSEAAARARAYVERELRWTGAELVGTESAATPAGAPLIAWIPGASDDRILVAAPWAPVSLGGGPDESGVATLLELARALSRQAAPYTIGIAVAMVEPSGEETGAADGPTHRAGAALVEALEADGGLEALRGVLVVDPRAGERSRFVRDLRSHPVFRDLFWRTAARLGHAARFPQEGGWATPDGIQTAFLAAGYGRVLSLVDERAVGVSTAGAVAARGPLPGPEAFEALGEVAYEGLTRLMERLARVDAFSR